MRSAVRYVSTELPGEEGERMEVQWEVSSVRATLKDVDAALSAHRALAIALQKDTRLRTDRYRILGKASHAAAAPSRESMPRRADPDL